MKLSHFLVSLLICTTSLVAAYSHQSNANDYKRCLLKNRQFPEYFYPVDGIDYDHSRRHVFAWMPGNSDSQCLWDLELYVGGRVPSFKIKSVQFGEYLFVDDNKYDADRRYAFTWKSGQFPLGEENSLWDLRVVQGSPADENYVTLKNKRFGEYLYAFDGPSFNNDGQRRQLFTWKFARDEDALNDYQTHWTFDCNN